jgi:hypothetical protein
MDSISRYHLSVREDGLWNVIDSATGGPAEVYAGGRFMLLFGLPEEDAQALSLLLNRALKLQKFEPAID